MSITSGLVLYAVIWFLTFLVVIPIRLKTQGDMGRVEPGTHSAAPEVHNLKKKAWITSGLSAAMWAIIVGIILSGWVTVADFDFMGRLD